MDTPHRLNTLCEASTRNREQSFKSGQIGAGLLHKESLGLTGVSNSLLALFQLFYYPHSRVTGLFMKPGIIN